jgi:XRE family transcriptional regulator, fatty acid utilization regulator
MPEANAVEFLQNAKVSESSLLKTSVITSVLAMKMPLIDSPIWRQFISTCQCTFLKVHESGAISKAYENDNVAFPSDVFGSVEGQIVCRNWSARKVFTIKDRFTPYHQYTDKPVGTYWCTSRIQTSAQGDFSVSVGTNFESVKYFRGRDSNTRYKSYCPDAKCCRQAPAELENKWGELIRPTPRLNSSLLAAIPQNGFLGSNNEKFLNS